MTPALASGGPRSTFLMYHELLVPGRSPVQAGAGPRPYLLPLATFREQVRVVRALGLRGASVTETLAFTGQPTVALTFDDGYASDWVAAAEVLYEIGFGATFYVTTSLIGTPGYVSRADVRALCRSGFEIGCHTATHPMLTQIPLSKLAPEIAGAKAWLADLLGRPVRHFACPGGRYDQHVIDAVKDAGYETCANSLRHGNGPSTSRWELGRVTVTADMGLAEFAAICQGRAMWRRELADRVRGALKGALEPRALDRAA